jgi:GNAT superfamily N-acetyltransferase
LADHLEHLHTLAAWFLDEWGFFVPGATLRTFADRLAQHLNRDQLPIAFIALEGRTPLGTASLRQYDMDTRRNLSPWLGGVYVVAPFRERGVGSELVRLAEAKAADLGFRVLHLFTFDKEAFYARRGWRVLERTTYRGHAVTVMDKVIGSAGVHSAA